MSNATTIAFSKMNGLGNDFVIIDARRQALALSGAQIRALSARDHRVTHGCDQLLVVHAPRPQDDGADVFMQIFNQDGSEAEACGNGTRAVAAFLREADTQSDVTIATLGGLLACHTPAPSNLERTPQFMPRVAMPLPAFDWQSIPLSAAHPQTSQISLDADVPPAFMVNVGNPHAVIFVDGGHAATAHAAETFGPALEMLPIFRDRANITFACLMDAQTIRLDTWERGVGLTQACGTGACATAIAAIEQGLTKSHTLTLRPPFNTDDNDQAVMRITYTPGQELIMSGPVHFDFSTSVDLEVDDG